MVEKILFLLLFVPISIYTTVQYAFIHWNKNHNLISSGKNVEAKGNWEKAKELPTLRYEFGAAAVGDEIYVAGGLYLPTIYFATGKTEAYNVKTDIWREVSPLPVQIHHPGVVSDGQYIYVIGGDGFKTTPVNVAYRYDPLIDEWEKLPDMPTKRGALVLAALNGKVYAIGGAAYETKFNTLEVYDTKTKKWETKKPMPTSREHLAVAVAGGKIYVFGGFFTERFESLRTVEVYDPETDSWSTGEPMPLQLNGFSAASLNNRIFIFGGQQGVAVSDEVHEYDTIANIWYRRDNLPFPRYAAVSVRVDDKIHLLGGNKVVGGSQLIKGHDIYTPL